MPITDATQAYVLGISNDVATALGNASPAKRDPIWVGLASDPLATLADRGLDDAFFADAQPDVKAAYASYLQTTAAAQMQQEEGRSGHAPRDYHWFACWSCRIGFGAIIVVVGAAITYATMGVGGPIYAAIVAQIAVRAAITTAAAEAIAGGALAAGKLVGAGAIGAIIELVCEAIPNTCA